MERLGEEWEKAVLLIIIVAIVIGSFSSGLADTLIQVIISGFIGAIFSAIAGTLVEALTGDDLKIILINIPIELFGMDFNISITLFAIITLIVQHFLFG
jgi:hypothetical protein